MSSYLIDYVIQAVPFVYYIIDYVAAAYLLRPCAAPFNKHSFLTCRFLGCNRLLNHLQDTEQQPSSSAALKAHFPDVLQLISERDRAKNVKDDAFALFIVKNR